jgi:hypothetical protein
MDFRPYLIRFHVKVALPNCTTPSVPPLPQPFFPSVAYEDFEAEIYAAEMLRAQGKMQSIDEILRELQADGIDH